MSLWKRGRQYWTDFTVAGRRYRKRLGTTNLRTATRRERELVEEAGHGRLSADEQGPKRLSDAIDAYLDCQADAVLPAHDRARGGTAQPRQEALRRRAALGDHRDGDRGVPAHAARGRHREPHDQHGRRCAVARAQVLRPVAGARRPRPESPGATASSRPRLDSQRSGSGSSHAAASNPEWEHVYCAAIVAANTSMRPVEVKHLRRCDVDLVKRLVHVRRSKNETSHRVIPLNASAIEAAARMFERADLLGHTEPEHYLWPACQWGRYDATKPMLKWDTAWRALRDEAGLHGLRFHDLRHTVITELAEMGVADHVLESISGHLSRRMLEHYSHIRIDAKRQALDALDDLRRRATAQMAMESRRKRRRKSRRSSRSPTTSRHSHVTVCFCRARRLPVNC